MASTFYRGSDARGHLSAEEAGVSRVFSKQTRVKSDYAPTPQQTIDQIHERAGWPPRVVGARNVRRSETVSSSTHFTVQDQRRCLQVALAHPDLADLLHGRWEVLGCNLVSERNAPRHIRHRVRVYVFNYTSNELAEICVEDERAISVTLQPPHMYPESPIEMAQAIALARSAPDLRKNVEDMSAHAILQVPDDPHGPSYGHRCFLVMFTDKDDPHKELPVRYFAMVDLRLQKILRSGLAPCCAPADANNRF